METLLVNAGMEYSNPSAIWSSATFIFPKLVTSKFRLIFELPLVSLLTILHDYSILILEEELKKLSRWKFFSKFDLSMGFCQVDFEADYRDCKYLVTSDGFLTLKRVLKLKNPVSNPQPSLAMKVPHQLQTSWLHWFLRCPPALKFCRGTGWRHNHPTKNGSPPALSIKTQ